MIKSSGRSSRKAWLARCALRCNPGMEQSGILVRFVLLPGKQRPGSPLTSCTFFARSNGLAQEVGFLHKHLPEPGVSARCSGRWGLVTTLYSEPWRSFFARTRASEAEEPCVRCETLHRIIFDPFGFVTGL